MLAWTMALLMMFVFVSGVTGMSTPLEPATAQYTPDMTEDQEWEAFHADAYSEYSDEFDALFNGYETRWSKNNRLMLRNGSSGPYKFVKRNG